MTHLASLCGLHQNRSVGHKIWVVDSLPVKNLEAYTVGGRREQAGDCVLAPLKFHVRDFAFTSSIVLRYRYIILNTQKGVKCSKMGRVAEILEALSEKQGRKLQVYDSGGQKAPINTAFHIWWSCQ